VHKIYDLWVIIEIAMSLKGILRRGLEQTSKNPQASGLIRVKRTPPKYLEGWKPFITAE